MTIIRQKWVFRSDLRANPKVAYVFGDNVNRVGLGGQAKEMRGEPNAYGIATLISPGIPFRDDCLRHNVTIMATDIQRLTEAKPEIIVFPSDGVGTGLAGMEAHAPLTYEAMNSLILGMLGIQNQLVTP